MIKSHIRKIIFVDQRFLEDIKNQSIASFKHFEAPNIDTKIITLPLVDSDLEDLVDYVDPTDIRPGGILVKPGYGNRFIKIDQFAEDHAVQKYRLWTLLCIALGAKEVTINSTEIINLEQQNERSISADMGIEAPLAQGDIGFNKDNSKEKTNNHKAFMELNIKGEGGKPDLEKAKAILDKYDLNKDDMFVNLYEIRSITSNQITNHNFSLDTSSDFKKIFDSSLKAQIKAMSNLYKGKSDFEATEKSLEKGRNALKLTVTVSF